MWVMMLSKKIKMRVKQLGLRFTPPGLYNQPRPIKLLQFYSVSGKKLKSPRIVKYTTDLAHNLFYHSGQGSKAFKTLWRK